MNNIIIAFFMPAFFVSSGFCSCFNVGFKSFLCKNVKTTLLPCFCLYYLNRYLTNLNVLLFGDSSWLTLKEWIVPGLRTFIRDGGYYWFLSALFIAKLLLWSIFKFIPQRFCVFVVVCCFCLGIVFYQYHLIPNVCFFQHALILILFLHLGHIGRKHEPSIMRRGWAVMLAFFGSVLLLTAFGFDIPTVTREISVTLANSPIFVLLSMMGTITVWWISKNIDHNKILETLGRESIVVYCLNFCVLVIVGNTLRHIMPQLLLGRMELIGVVLTFVLSFVLLHTFGWTMNQKYLRVLLGRF